MAQTKQEKITSIEGQIKQLENQRKQLIQKQKEDERKARTKRLCSRHGLLESIMPELIPITDEQFKIFIEKAVANSYGRDILNKIILQSAGSEKTKTPAEMLKTAATPTPNHTATNRNGGNIADGNVGGGATVEG